MDQTKLTFQVDGSPEVYKFNGQFFFLATNFPDCDGELCAEEDEEMRAAKQLSAVAAAVPGRLLGEAAVSRPAGALPRGRGVVAVVGFQGKKPISGIISFILCCDCRFHVS